MEDLVWNLLFAFGGIWATVTFAIVCAIALFYFLLKRLKSMDEEKFEKRSN